MNGGSKDDGLRSPLAKRKKLAADRTGYSRLKEAITADDLQEHPSEAERKGISKEDEKGGGRIVSMSSAASTVDEDMEGGDDDGDEEEEDDDDFLARELEEEWG